MDERTWEVGDRFHDDGVWTVVQVHDETDALPEGVLLVGRWFVRYGKREAGYRFVTEQRIRYKPRKEESKRTTGPKFTVTEAKRLYKEADAAGMEALRAATPAPMLVGTPKNLMGSLLPGGDDGGFDETKPTYFVEGGPCGFAWVTIFPGNSSLAYQWKKLGYASPAYGGGVSVWVREGGQSMQRKEAYARAFERVVRDAGVTAYAGSRMD